MAKKTQKTEPVQNVVKPAVRRSKTVKTPAATKASTPTRRASSRARKAVAFADDRGLSASTSVEVLAIETQEPTRDEVATRAYFIHLRRNGAPGNMEQDWMLAIEELRRERGLI